MHYDREGKTMDAEERDRRQEIETKERAIYKKISDEVAKLYDHIKKAEDKLEDRDREIEAKTNDRFTKHEVDISKVRTDLDNHVGNNAIHKRPVSMETLQNMQRPDLPGIAGHRQPISGQYQSQMHDSRISEASDEFSKMGVPWYFNPKWVLAVGTAVAGIIGAIVFAISSGKSAEKPSEGPVPVVSEEEPGISAEPVD